MNSERPAKQDSSASFPALSNLRVRRQNNDLRRVSEIKAIDDLEVLIAQAAEEAKQAGREEMLMEFNASEGIREARRDELEHYSDEWPT